MDAAKNGLQVPPSPRLPTAFLRWWQLALALVALTQIFARTLYGDCAPKYQLRPDVIASGFVELTAALLLLYAFAVTSDRARIAGVLGASLLTGLFAGSALAPLLVPLAALGIARLPRWRLWLIPLVASAILVGTGLPAEAQRLMTGTQFLCP